MISRRFPRFQREEREGKGDFETSERKSIEKLVYALNVNGVDFVLNDTDMPFSSLSMAKGLASPKPIATTDNVMSTHSENSTREKRIAK